MQCNCGGETHEKTQTLKGEIVARYDQCRCCGRVRVFMDSTGKTTKRAIAHNLELFGRKTRNSH